MQQKLNRFWSKLGWFFGFNMIFLLSDAFSTYKCYTYSESFGSKEHSGNLISVSWVEIKTPGIFSSLRTQTGPWSDTFSYVFFLGLRRWFGGMEHFEALVLETTYFAAWPSHSKLPLQVRVKTGSTFNICSRKGSTPDFLFSSHPCEPWQTWWDLWYGHQQFGTVKK